MAATSCRTRLMPARCLVAGTQAQMWNWGYDAIQAQPVERLAHEICITAWFIDTATKQTNTLPEACIDFVVSWTDAPPPAPAGLSSTAAALPNISAPMSAEGTITSYFQPDHSAAHAFCGERHCRLNTHGKKKMAFFPHFILDQGHFPKTGSGQT